MSNLISNPSATVANSATAFNFSVHLSDPVRIMGVYSHV